jgi:hypothetical protein
MAATRLSSLACIRAKTVAGRQSSARGASQDSANIQTASQSMPTRWIRIIGPKVSRQSGSGKEDRRRRGLRLTSRLSGPASRVFADEAVAEPAAQRRVVRRVNVLYRALGRVPPEAKPLLVGVDQLRAWRTPDRSPTALAAGLGRSNLCCRGRLDDCIHRNRQLHDNVGVSTLWTIVLSDVLASQPSCEAVRSLRATKVGIERRIDSGASNFTLERPRFARRSP